MVTTGRTAFAVNVAKPKADGIDETTSNPDETVAVARDEPLNATEIVGVTDIVAFALLDVDTLITALEVAVAKPERLDVNVTGKLPIGAPSLAATKAIPI